MNRDFRNLVDSVQPTLYLDPDTNDSLRDYYNHFGIEHNNSLTLQEITDHLNENIRNCLIGNDLPGSQLKDLREHLLLSHLVNQEKLQPYFGILKVILGAIGNIKIVNIANTHKWESALQFAWDYIVIYPAQIKYNLNYLQRIHQRQFVVSESSKYLQKKGCKIKIVNGKIYISESDTRIIAKRIESNIKNLGGREFLSKLFNLIHKNYSKIQDRYHLGRQLKSYALPSSKPAIPIGYLLNLGVKYINGNTKYFPKNTDHIWKNIVEDSTALCAVKDVEQYTYLELMFKDQNNIVRFIQDLAVYDNLFCPIQLRSADATKIIRGLFLKFSGVIEEKLGWSIEDAVIVADKILDMAKASLSLIEFSKEEMYHQIPKMEREKIDKLLSIYSHKHNLVNNKFQIPEDLSRIEFKNYFQHKPLIKTDHNKYILVNSAYCASAFYESITINIRDLKVKHESSKKKIKIDNTIGYQVEEFIQEEFKKRSINFEFSKYKSSDDEIDIAVETSDSIIFFEIKAKALIRKSRVGKDLELLIDLADSLLHSQYQANKHELFLRNNGFIHFENSGYQLDFNNKNIIKISISLLDFGSFQDRTFIFEFLQCLLNGELKSEDDTIAKKVDKINELIDQFKNNFSDLINLNPEYESKPFFNCYYLSLPQLLIILDQVNSGEDLRNEICKLRSVSFSTMDFYQEYFYINKLF